jgi:hypothetical protein
MNISKRNNMYVKDALVILPYHYLQMKLKVTIQWIGRSMKNYLCLDLLRNIEKP